MKYIIQSGGSQFDVEIDRKGAIRVNGEPTSADLRQVANSSSYSLLLGNRSFELQIEKMEENFQVQIKGVSIDVRVQDERAKLLAGIRSSERAATGEVLVRSPMPGIIIDLPVKVGDQVHAGQLLAVVESMKMHNEFSAPRAGVVKAIRVALGEKVLQNTILVSII